MLKKEIELALEAANKLIVDQREAIETAARANIAINKEMLSEKVEVRRLRKVLDRAITAVDCRISTIGYIPPLMTVPAGYVPEEVSEEPQKSEDEKFLRFLAGQVLHDQYKPENKGQFGHGFGY